ncbi:hypothetical protein H5410_003196 [Solanum commersonii]|uniref:Putative plant transposon protein domain-containing protein n=1 Tax=Solanum commersonii TaxID=4109 RepID=A0A9J6B4Z8_SOLCO|nr:hypothetical protein H5410_003196 [Solanum commersonii]
MSGTQRPGKEVATSNQRKDSLAKEFPQIIRCIQELHMELIFDEPTECNLHVVREFYANSVTESRSHFVKVQGIDVTLTPAFLNDIVGTAADTDLLSMVKWTKHSAKRFHQSLHYVHMSREAWVRLKIVLNCLIPRLNYTDITRDKVYLFYALMTNTELNIDVVFKSALGRFTRGEFGLYDTSSPVLVEMTKTKGPNNEFSPPLTTLERHHRDELIMAHMYGLEMLCHQNKCLESTEEQLEQVERRYPLNVHANALLGISSEFHELVDDDVPTDEERMRIGSDVDSDSDTEEATLYRLVMRQKAEKPWRIDQGVIHLPYCFIYNERSSHEGLLNANPQGQEDLEVESQSYSDNLGCDCHFLDSYESPSSQGLIGVRVLTDFRIIALRLLGKLLRDTFWALVGSWLRPYDIMSIGNTLLLT